MQPEEIDIALDELENRLDRLRSLYEQYFLGIEKIEPSVARKDVDRRFWILRRVQIRNTARRFRLQNIVQRYNTFQQYWTRICREIENGTYVRHLLKAQKNLGAEPQTWAAKKRLGLFRRGATDAAGPEGAAAKADDSDLGGLLDSGADLDREAEHAAADAVASLARMEQPRPPAGPARRIADLGLLDLDFDDGLVAGPAPVKVAPKLALPLPATARGAASTAGAATPKAATGPIAAQFAAQQSSNGALIRPAAPANPPAPPERPATPAAPQAARAAVPLGDLRDAWNRLEQQAPGPTAGPRGLHVGGVAGTQLSDARLKELHAELVATRRKLNQTDNVSLDSLARSLRDTESKLLTQHRGRSVDFHVVVKDGKPVVKPVVRK